MKINRHVIPFILSPILIIIGLNLQASDRFEFHYSFLFPPPMGFEGISSGHEVNLLYHFTSNDQTDKNILVGAGYRASQLVFAPALLGKKYTADTSSSQLGLRFRSGDSKSAVDFVARIGPGRVSLISNSSSTKGDMWELGSDVIVQFTPSKLNALLLSLGVSVDKVFIQSLEHDGRIFSSSDFDPYLSFKIGIGFRF